MLSEPVLGTGPEPGSRAGSLQLPAPLDLCSRNLRHFNKKAEPLPRGRTSPATAGQRRLGQHISLHTGTATRRHLRCSVLQRGPAAMAAPCDAAPQLDARPLMDTGHISAEGPRQGSRERPTEGKSSEQPGRRGQARAGDPQVWGQGRPASLIPPLPGLSHHRVRPAQRPGHRVAKIPHGSLLSCSWRWR